MLSAPESSYEQARFTKISTRPQEEITESTSFAIEESSVTSPWKKVAPHALAAAAPLSAFISTIKTLAPSLISVFATAAPNKVPPPVTIATLPFNDSELM